MRINCISPGQIDVGVDLKDIDMRGMASQLPPASLQSKEVRQRFNIQSPVTLLFLMKFLSLRPVLKYIIVGIPG